MNRALKKLLSLAAAFLALGILHGVLYGVSYANVVVQLIMCAVLISRAAEVKRIVTHEKTRRLILLLYGLLIAYFALQMAKFRLFSTDNILYRYSLYAYTAPTVLSALVTYYIALAVSEEAPVRPVRKALPFFVSLALIVFVLTNDLHRLCYVADKNGLIEKRTVGGYLVLAWIGALFTVSFFIFLKNIRSLLLKKDRLLPTVPLFGLGFYVLLDAFGLIPRINGAKMWNVTETYCFCIIVFIEMCIETGLIPSNIAYKAVFYNSGFNARILDGDRHVFVSSGVSSGALPREADLRTSRKDIAGGFLEWKDDISEIRRITAQIEETGADIAARNEYLISENKVKKEKAETESKMALYRGVSRCCEGQLNRIREMTEDEAAFSENMPEIAVLVAYVKRRSNFELIKENKQAKTEDLFIAIRESLKYLSLSGADCSVVTAAEGVFDIEDVIAAYETFETVAEGAFRDLHSMSVVLSAEGSLLSLRIMLCSDSFDASIPDVRRGTLNVAVNGNDLLVNARFGKEAARHEDR